MNSNANIKEEKEDLRKEAQMNSNANIKAKTVALGEKDLQFQEYHPLVPNARVMLYKQGQTIKATKPKAKTLHQSYLSQDLLTKLKKHQQWQNTLPKNLLVSAPTRNPSKAGT
jgi:hypothetical protein